MTSESARPNWQCSCSPAVRMTQLRGLVVIALVAAFAAACGSSSPVFTEPTGDPKVETFTNTIDVGGIGTHTFNVTAANGQLVATLASAGPPSTIFMGFALGMFSNSVCAPFTDQTGIFQAGSTTQLGGTANAGAYCVQVYDVGNQTGPVTYTVTVSHF